MEDVLLTWLSSIKITKSPGAPYNKGVLELITVKGPSGVSLVATT